MLKQLQLLPQNSMKLFTLSDIIFLYVLSEELVDIFGKIPTYYLRDMSTDLLERYVTVINICCGVKSIKYIYMLQYNPYCSMLQATGMK